MDKKQNKKQKLPSAYGLGEEKDFLIENLAVLLSSGMNVPSALNAIEKEICSKRLKQLMTYIKNEIDEGIPLWSAFQNAKLFPFHYIALIAIGENSGSLSESLKILAETQHKERTFRAKVRSATIYPTFVMAAVLIVGLGVAWFILPQLSLVFSRLGTKVPLLTKILISAGEILRQYGLYIVPGMILLLALSVYIFFFSPKFNKIGQWVFLSIPLTRRIITESEISRSSFVLDNLLKGGMPIVGALDSLERSTLYYYYKQLYRHLKTNIEEGNSFEKSFQSFQGLQKIFPITVQEMIVTGEQSGNLPEIFESISKNYEEKVEITTKNIAAIIEPVLLIIIWFFVAIVALAVIMPIYSLIGSLPT